MLKPKYHFCLTMSIHTPTPSASAEKQASSNIENLKSKALLYYKMGDKNLGAWHLSRALDLAQQENVVISCAEVDAIVAGKAMENAPQANLSETEATRPSETPQVVQESQNFNQQIQTLLEPWQAMMAEIEALFQKICELLPSLQLKETTAH